MAEIKVTLNEAGRAFLRLSAAEVRDSVALAQLEEADSIPALGELGPDRSWLLRGSPPYALSHMHPGASATS